MPDASFKPPHRILIIRPSALGDVCRSVPVLASLKRRWPEAEIDWLVQSQFADAVRAHPDLAGVVSFDRRGLGASLRRLNPRPTLRFIGDLRRAGYHLAIDCQGLLRSGLFAGATGAECRVGDRNARELGWLFYNERPAIDPTWHTVDRMLALVEAAGIEPVRDMRLYPPPGAWQSLSARHAELGHDPFIVLAPTSRWTSKRWPIDRFTALAESLLSEGAARIAIVGGPGERDQCSPLLDLAQRDRRVTDLIADTSVGELMALIERSRLLVANDSAALHMGVGFDRPLVSLYGPTRVDLVGPYRREVDVIQHITPADSLDHKLDANVALMERIGIDEVAEACAKRLG